MVAFDTDIISRLLVGDPTVLARLMGVPIADRTIPIVATEEVLRGRLNSIRQASAGRGKTSLERAYQLLLETLDVLCPLKLLPYTAPADALIQTWRKQKIRVGTNDLRIAAISIVHGAKLVTRNVRDYGMVPGLNYEVW